MLKFLAILFFSLSVAVAEVKQEEGLLQKVDNVKVGFVNIRKLITNAPQVEIIRKNLSQEFEHENNKIIKLRQSISKLNADYESRSTNVPLDKLQSSLNKKQIELIKLQQNLNDSYSLRRNEELGQLQTLIVETVAAISKEKSLDIVLNNTGVIYINGRVDITKAVFERLSQQARVLIQN